MNIATKDYVLRAIADDYEDFPMILEEVQRWSQAQLGSVTKEDVLSALEQLVVEGYAQTYILSSTAPYAKPVGFSRQNLNALSFYVTKKGRNALSQIEFDHREDRDKGSTGDGRAGPE